MPTIAYLAPALTALESTFVYDELFAVENEGFCVVPVSVHRAIKLLVGHDDLLARTHYLYTGNWIRTLVRTLTALPGLCIGDSLRWLAKDVGEIGFWKRQAWKLIFQYVVAVDLAKTLKSSRCQHLHIHFAHVPTQVGMYAAALAGIPFTVMAHANDIFERGLLLVQKAERAKMFLTISEHNRNYLLSLGLPAEKLAVVRCGVSFQPPAIWPSPIIKASYRIGTLGRLVEKKGVDVLLKAMVGLKKVHLSIAGDGPLRQELETLAVQLGVSQSVEFVGSLTHSDVATWLAGLDTFVLACKQDSNGDMDGIPVVLMEAMSQGIPVVSTRLSGIPELVMHEHTGLLATPDDAADLAVQISRLLASAELRERLARDARDHVEQEFGQQVNINRLLNHFELDQA